MATYIPFKHLEFDSDYGAQKIRQIITNSVAPITWFPVRPSPKPFRGRVKNGGFYIVRAIPGKNSFQPVAYGTLVEGNGQTRVKVNITLHYSVIAFSAVMVPMYVFFWFVISSIFMDRRLALLFAFSVAFFFYLVILHLYNAESKLLVVFISKQLSSN